jgi:translation initiation factor 3 subunit D
VAVTPILLSFRYLKWDLGGNLGMVARCEFDAITPTAGGNFYINIKALNEWDPKVRGQWLMERIM